MLSSLLAMLRYQLLIILLVLTYLNAMSLLHALLSSLAHRLCSIASSISFSPYEAVLSSTSSSC